MGAFLKSALFAALLLCTLSLAADVCPVPPTVRTYVDVVKSAGETHTLTATVFNESIIEGDLVRLPVNNGLLVVVKKVSRAGEGARGYAPCLVKTGIEGTATIAYVPPEEEEPSASRTTYYFRYCPMSHDREFFSACAAVPDPNDASTYIQYNGWNDFRLGQCGGGSISEPRDRPTHLPALSEIAIENRTKPDNADLCWPLMLIVGLLAGGMFAAGRSPFAAFDFSAPRLSRGRQYNARAQNKSFDTTSLSFAAVNLSSVGIKGLLGGKTEVKVDKDGKTLLDAKTGKVVGGIDAKGNAIVNGRTVGKIDGGNLVLSKTTVGHGNAKLSFGSQTVSDIKAGSTFSVRQIGTVQQQSFVRSGAEALGGGIAKGAAAGAKKVGLDKAASAGGLVVKNAWTPTMRAGKKFFTETKVGRGAAATGEAGVKLVGFAITPLRTMGKIGAWTGKQIGKGATAVGLDKHVKKAVGAVGDTGAWKFTARQAKAFNERKVGSKIVKGAMLPAKAVWKVGGGWVPQAKKGSVEGQPAKTQGEGGVQARSDAAYQGSVASQKGMASNILSMPTTLEGVFKLLGILFGKSAGEKETAETGGPMSAGDFMDAVGRDALKKLMYRLMMFALLAALKGKFGGSIGKAFGKAGGKKLISIKGQGKFDIGDGLGVLMFTDYLVLPVFGDMFRGAKEKWGREMGKMQNAQAALREAQAQEKKYQGILSQSEEERMREIEERRKSIGDNEGTISGNKSAMGQNKEKMKELEKGSAGYRALEEENARLSGENAQKREENGALKRQIGALESRSFAFDMLRDAQADRNKAALALQIAAEDEAAKLRKDVYGGFWRSLFSSVGIMQAQYEKKSKLEEKLTHERQAEFSKAKDALDGLPANASQAQKDAAQGKADEAQAKLNAVHSEVWGNRDLEMLGYVENQVERAKSISAATEDARWASRQLSKKGISAEEREYAQDLIKEAGKFTDLQASSFNIAQKVIELKEGKDISEYVSGLPKAFGGAAAVVPAMGSAALGQQAAAVSGLLLSFAGALGAGASATYVGFKISGKPTSDITPESADAAARFSAGIVLAGGQLDANAMGNAAKGMDDLKRSYSSLAGGMQALVDKGYWQLMSEPDREGISRQYAQLLEGLKDGKDLQYSEIGIGKIKEKNVLVGEDGKPIGGDGRPLGKGEDALEVMLGKKRDGYSPVLVLENGQQEELGRIGADGRIERGAYASISREEGRIAIATENNVVYENVRETVGDAVNGIGIGNVRLEVLGANGLPLAAFICAAGVSSGFLARDMGVERALLGGLVNTSIGNFSTDMNGIYTHVDEKGSKYGAGLEEWRGQLGKQVEDYDEIKGRMRLGLGVSAAKEKDGEAHVFVERIDKPDLPFGFGFKANITSAQLASDEEFKKRMEENLLEALKNKLQLKDKMDLEMRVEGEGSVLKWLAEHKEVLSGTPIVITVGAGASVEEAADDKGNRKLAGERRGIGIEAIGLVAKEYGIDGLVQVREGDARVDRYYDVKEAGKLSADERENAAGAFNSLVSLWKGQVGGEAEVQKAIDAKVIGQNDDGTYGLLDRAKFESGFSKGSTNAAGNHENKNAPALEAALSQQRQFTVGIEMNVVQQERIEVPYVQMLATEHRIASAVAMDYMTQSLYEELKYKQKDVRDKYITDVGRGIDGMDPMGAGVTSARESIMSARAKGESVGDLVNAAYGTLGAATSEADAYTGRAVERRGEWERFYEMQGYVSARQYLKAHEMGPDPDDLFLRTMFTVPKAVVQAVGGSEVMKDTPSFVFGESINPVTAELGVMERNRGEYRVHVINDIDTGKGIFAQVKTEPDKIEVRAFAEKAANEKENEKLMQEFVAATPARRLEMHGTYLGEEGKQGLEELKETFKDLKVAPEEQQARVDEYIRASDAEREQINAAIKYMRQNKARMNEESIAANP